MLLTDASASLLSNVLSQIFTFGTTAPPVAPIAPP
jgi:hypothetical protein